MIFFLYLISRNISFKIKKNPSDNPGTRTLNKILDDQIRDLEEAAAEQGISREEYLDLLSRRCRQIWKVDEKGDKSRTLSVKDATALIYNLDLSVNKYQVFRIRIRNADLILSSNTKYTHV